MDIRIRILIVVLSVAFLLFLLNMVRKNKISLKYSLIWMLATVSVLVLGIFPNLIEFVSRLLGIHSPMNAMFFLGFLFVLLILYSLAIIQSRTSNKVKKIIQFIALNDYYQRMEKEEFRK